MKGTWSPEIASDDKRVYLTDCYALKYAYDAARRGVGLAIFEIAVARLDQRSLLADEDAVAEFTAMQEKKVEVCSGAGE